MGERTYKVEISCYEPAVVGSTMHAMQKAGAFVVEANILCSVIVIFATFDGSAYKRMVKAIQGLRDVPNVVYKISGTEEIEVRIPASKG